jgi:hypothetical protein
VRLLALVLVVLAGCGRAQPALPTIPAEVKHVAFEVVARGDRCEPAVLAADREGRALVLDFLVTSVGKAHRFLIPDLGVRRSIPAGTRLEIPVLVERSGIHEFACTSSRWVGALTSTGQLAFK